MTTRGSSDRELVIRASELGQGHFPSAMCYNPTRPVAANVLAASGGEFGGWSLFLKGRKLRTANYLNSTNTRCPPPIWCLPGKHKLSMHFVPKEKSLKPDFFTGDVTLSINDAKAGELKDIKWPANAARSLVMVFSSVATPARR